MSHTTLTDLREKLTDAERFVFVGAHYAHYRNPGQHYEVTGLSIREEDEEVAVIYVPLYSEEKVSFDRKLSVWLEEVEHEGKRVPRFSRVET